MTTHRLIQNFRRSQGLLWASSDFNADVLERTLLKLGVSLKRVDLVKASDLDPDRDIVFLDADQPINPAPLLQPGAHLSAAPVIGIVGVEAPSRLKLLAEAGATAILRKPIQGATIYSALFLGVNNHRRLNSAEARLAVVDRKRRGRRFLIKAVLALVQARGMTDDDAYAELRRESMRRRLDLEEFCEALLQPDSNFPAAWPRGLVLSSSHDRGGSAHAQDADVGRRDRGDDVDAGGASRRAYQDRRA
jgi:AmiR/NasT family two-component response regulator